MEKISTPLTEMLGIKYPMIIAPMFLVSNAAMLKAAIKSGVTAAVPALNYRTDKAFREAIEDIRAETDGPFGVNLIVNKSNIRMMEQLNTCVEMKVDFIITSLGSPRKVIELCKPAGVKVFCDVVDVHYAKKCEELGADAVIAVNKEAGGHAGPTPATELVPALVEACNIPVISAGGVGNGYQWKEKLELGAVGISMGSPFIATEEAGVSQDYKQACVDYGAKDIVMTTKLSGTPCTVINTPYMQEIGTNQNWLETFLNKNKKLKKFAKMLTAYKGMKMLEKAAMSATYKTVWCAGPSIEYVKSIRPIKAVVDEMVEQMTTSKVEVEK
ncbi:nitronate monooxygenase [Flammeovirga yaeyamensis]|uniref:Nitronate monooxygenase n=1 Tax=Flammeovirga yaeyamensis TaxID=367791 RepID=A0AAX1N9L2_9BACT|nr:nitronate monooxygenase [Flammeovirga yaeyamensis]MBB3701475.1 nitronate monooxygenase [Flammeovirga yaeyamensis]NMF38600.1 nitronate monooxygenase [Flammeovirga yaeyamensis]QWG02737.1 nitronate monooxygenase [Flammeovirga yaeyamensis]